MSEPTPAVTVAVPTHGRPASLPACVRSLVAAAETSACEVAEVLLVENGVPSPTAATQALARDDGRVRVRVLHHPTPSCSLARNLALAQATTDVVAFVDDDVEVEPGWLDALVAPLADPSVHAAVGPVVLAFRPDRPAWLTPHLTSWFSALDLGEHDRTLAPDEHGWGANVALRREAALAVGGYDVSLGPGTGLFAEDTELLDRLRAAGGRVAYASAATVHHQLGPDRLRLRWLARRTHQQGRSDELLVLRSTPLTRAQRLRRATRALAHVPRRAPGAALRAFRDPVSRPGLLAEQVAIASQGVGRVQLLVNPPPTAAPSHHQPKVLAGAGTGKVSEDD